MTRAISFTPSWCSIDFCGDRHGIEYDEAGLLIERSISGIHIVNGLGCVQLTGIDLAVRCADRGGGEENGCDNTSDRQSQG